MKRWLYRLALLIFVGAFVTWLATGKNRGWTKTTRMVKTMDEVTGIEGITYQKQFVPGIDFLGAALLTAGAVAGLSVFLPNKPNQN